jgi:hypothetical protein
MRADAHTAALPLLRQCHRQRRSDHLKKTPRIETCGELFAIQGPIGLLGRGLERLLQHVLRLVEQTHPRQHRRACATHQRRPAGDAGRAMCFPRATARSSGLAAGADKRARLP